MDAPPALIAEWDEQASVLAGVAKTIDDVLSIDGTGTVYEEVPKASELPRSLAMADALITADGNPVRLTHLLCESETGFLRAVCRLIRPKSLPGVYAPVAMTVRTAAMRVLARCLDSISGSLPDSFVSRATPQQRSIAASSVIPILLRHGAVSSIVTHITANPTTTGPTDAHTAQMTASGLMKSPLEMESNEKLNGEEKSLLRGAQANQRITALDSLRAMVLLPGPQPGAGATASPGPQVRASDLLSTRAVLSAVLGVALGAGGDAGMDERLWAWSVMRAGVVENAGTATAAGGGSARGADLSLAKTVGLGPTRLMNAEVSMMEILGATQGTSPLASTGLRNALMHGGPAAIRVALAAFALEPSPRVRLSITQFIADSVRALEAEAWAESVRTRQAPTLSVLTTTEETHGPQPPPLDILSASVLPPDRQSGRGPPLFSAHSATRTLDGVLSMLTIGPASSDATTFPDLCADTLRACAARFDHGTDYPLLACGILTMLCSIMRTAGDRAVDLVALSASEAEGHGEGMGGAEGEIPPPFPGTPLADSLPRSRPSQLEEYRKAAAAPLIEFFTGLHAPRQALPRILLDLMQNNSAPAPVVCLASRCIRVSVHTAPPILFVDGSLPLCISRDDRTDSLVAACLRGADSTDWLPEAAAGVRVEAVLALGAALMTVGNFECNAKIPAIFDMPAYGKVLRRALRDTWDALWATPTGNGEGCAALDIVWGMELREHAPLGEAHQPLVHGERLVQQSAKLGGQIRASSAVGRDLKNRLPTRGAIRIVEKIFGVAEGTIYSLPSRPNKPLSGHDDAVLLAMAASLLMNGGPVTWVEESAQLEGTDIEIPPIPGYDIRLLAATMTACTLNDRARRKLHIVQKERIKQGTAQGVDSVQHHTKSPISLESRVKITTSVRQSPKSDLRTDPIHADPAIPGREEDQICDGVLQDFSQEAKADAFTPPKRSGPTIRKSASRPTPLAPTANITPADSSPGAIYLRMLRAAQDPAQIERLQREKARSKNQAQKGAPAKTGTPRNPMERIGLVRIGPSQSSAAVRGAAP